METRHLNPGWSHIRNRKNKKKSDDVSDFKQKKETHASARLLYTTNGRRNVRLRLGIEKKNQTTSSHRPVTSHLPPPPAPAQDLAPHAAFGPCARRRTRRQLTTTARRMREEEVTWCRTTGGGGSSIAVVVVAVGKVGNAQI
jgi:hypothetical protein